MFGWTPEQILNMRARQFFSVVNEAREIHRKRQAHFYYQMSNVAMCAQADVEWIQKLQRAFIDEFDPPKPVSMEEGAARIARMMR